MLVKRIIFLVAIFLCMPQIGASGAESLATLKRLDRDGNVSATYNLGVRYWEGKGVKQSDAKAVEYFKKAAEELFPPAVFTMGIAFQTGRGVDLDLEAARDWFRKSFSLGYEKAGPRLARLELSLAKEIDDKGTKLSEVKDALSLLKETGQMSDPRLAYEIAEAHELIGEVLSALNMYKKADAAGHELAGYRWANLAISSEKLYLKNEVDVELSLRAENGDLASLNLLTRTLLEGEYLAQDLIRSVSLLEDLINTADLGAEFLGTYEIALFELASSRPLTVSEINILDRAANNINEKDSSLALYLGARLQFLQVTEHNSQFIRLNDALKKSVRSMVLGNRKAVPLTNRILEAAQNMEVEFSVEEAKRTIIWLEKYPSEMSNVNVEVAALHDKVSKIVKRGARVALATTLQQRLADLGYFEGLVDGKLGPKSRDALRKLLADVDQNPSLADGALDKLVSLMDKALLLSVADECDYSGSSKQIACFEISL